MSESERQHVQARVRAAMDAQVINEGRHQGGRAPYGYIVVDSGPHPNPRKAIEGFRLRVLETDETAEVVRRIFADYRRFDVSDLALTDVDLRRCRFASAHHLDKLRIEGVRVYVSRQRTPSHLRTNP